MKRSPIKRVPRESAQALDAYAIYRDLGPDRSLERVAQECTKSSSLIRRWSSLHGWGERVRAHDAAIAQTAAERDKQAKLALMDKRREDRIKVAAAVRGKAVAALAQMTPEELAKRPYAVTQMLDYADKSERLDMGEATERNDVNAKVDIDGLLGLLPDELRRDVIERARAKQNQR
jgi:hypothetical protein